MSRWLVALLALLVAGSIGGWMWRHVVDGSGPGLDALDLAVEPAAIVVDPDRLEAALDASPWISEGRDGRVLWAVGHRSCLACIGYLRSEARELGVAGVDVRVILFAPDDADAGERAVLAAIGARRSWPTLRAYVEGSAADYEARGRFPSAADPVRTAIIAAGRRTRDEVEAVLQANGYEVVYPLLFWQDDAGAWFAAVGDTTRGRRAIRQTFADGAGE